MTHQELGRQTSSVQTFDSLQCGVSVAEKDTITLIFIILVIQQHFSTGKNILQIIQCANFFTSVLVHFKCLFIYDSLLSIDTFSYLILCQYMDISYQNFFLANSQQKNWMKNFHKTWTYIVFPSSFFFFQLTSLFTE